MTEILSAKQMQDCDKRTIEKHEIPSLVLMERAALKVVETIEKEYEKQIRDNKKHTSYDRNQNKNK